MRLVDVVYVWVVNMYGAWRYGVVILRLLVLEVGTLLLYVSEEGDYTVSFAFRVACFVLDWLVAYAALCLLCFHLPA